MDQLRRTVSNSVILLVGQAVTWTSTLLLTIAYGRYLGALKFGELYLALTFVALLGVPLEFGYEKQCIRGVAQEPHKASRYFTSTLLIKLGLWPIVYTLALVVSWRLGYSTEVRVLVAICGCVLLSHSIANTFTSLHYASERTIFPAIGNILEKGLTALFGILLLQRGAGVQTMALVMLGAALASGIWQAIWFFRLQGARFVVDPALIRDILRTSVPFLIYGLLGTAYYSIDTVLLSLMTGSAVVGWYGAAGRLFDTLAFLPSIVMIVLFPVSSKLSLSSDESLKRAVEKSVNFLLFCGIPIATGMIVAAPNIVRFLYHRAEFAHTIPALMALAPGLVFLYVSTALNILMLSKKQERKLPMMAAIALVFNVGLNLLFIPLYRHVAAAIVTSLTEVLLSCLAIAFIPRYLWPVASLRVGVKAMLASLVMALAILPLRAHSIVAILPVATLVYVAVGILVGVVPPEDIKAVYSALRRKGDEGATPEPWTPPGRHARSCHDGGAASAVRCVGHRAVGSGEIMPAEPQRADLHRKVGFLLAKQRRSEDAAAAFRRAVEYARCACQRLRDRYIGG